MFQALSLINRLRRLWNKYGFEILLLASVLFIIGYWFFYTRTKDSGTFATDFEYEPTSQRKKRRGPPKCSKGEAECRRVLERVFGQPFPNQRPSYLSNSITGHALEIDCYNEGLKLGCEYHGRQHYEYTPFMHRSRDAFRNQQYRDQIKRDKCRELGIKLISVPYTVSLESIEGFIVSKLEKFGYNL